MVEVIKLGGPLGAEIRGVDPRKPLSEAEAKVVHQAFLDHLILRFRGAPLSVPQLRDFSRTFGVLRPHAAKAYHDKEVPEVVIMTNLDANGNYDEVGATRGVGWHVDGTFQQDPTKATILHSVALPDRGGNTAFANMYLAWDTMPDELKRRIDGLTALHRLRGRKSYTQGIVSAEEMKRMTEVRHPVVRVHPETGKKAVFVNPHHTLQIEGMTREASDELLEEIFAWCERPAFQWEQEWQVGDTIIWENRCAWHSGRTDYPKNQLRKFYRTSIFEFGSNSTNTH